MAQKLRAPVRLATAETQRVIYTHSPDFGAQPADVTNPAYWEHVAKQLKHGDRIEVTAADLSWFVELIVRAATRSEVVVSVLRQNTFDDSAVLMPDNKGLSVKWRGGAKWSVVRDKDGEVLMSGFLDESAAHKWLENRHRAEAA